MKVTHTLAPSREEDAFPAQTQDLAGSKTCIEANNGEVPKGLGCVLDVLLFLGLGLEFVPLVYPFRSNESSGRIR
jgi:hypothetical protein